MASLSSISAPSTDISTSVSCGGTRRDDDCFFSRGAIADRITYRHSTAKHRRLASKSVDGALIRCARTGGADQAPLTNLRQSSMLSAVSMYTRKGMAWKVRPVCAFVLLRRTFVSVGMWYVSHYSICGSFF